MYHLSKKREEAWDLHIWKMHISVSAMYCLAQPACYWIPGPYCDSKRSHQSTIPLHYALQETIVSKAQFLIPCWDLTAWVAKTWSAGDKKQFLPRELKPPLSSRQVFHQLVQEFNSHLSLHTAGRQRKLCKTQHSPLLCVFSHLSKVDLGCSSTTCAYYTPKKKRIFLAFYELWTHATVLSYRETPFAFLSLYSIQPLVHLIGLGLVWVFLKKH